MRDDRQDNMRWMLRVVIDAHVGNACGGRADFGRTRLQIARKVREKRTGNLHANAMTREKSIARQHTI